MSLICVVSRYRKVSRLQMWFRVELPLVSTRVRLLSLVMGDQTTLGRMSLRWETIFLVKELLSNFCHICFFVVDVNRLLTTSWSMNWWNPKQVGLMQSKSKGDSREIHVSCSYSIMKEDFNHLGSSSCVQLGANDILDACKPGAILNGIRLYKRKVEEQQVNIY